MSSHRPAPRNRSRVLLMVLLLASTILLCELVVNRAVSCRRDDFFRLERMRSAWDERVEGSRVVSETSKSFSKSDRLTFVHECQGRVLTPRPFSYMDEDAEMPSYCVGTNVLSVRNADGTEVAKVAESVSTSAKDAPILGDVSWVPARGGNMNGTVLVEFGHNDCSVTEDDCGVGSPTNNVTYALSLATNEVRAIENYPGRGTPIWNGAGTKAIFPVTQVGGAGCDDGPIVGYDLAADATKALTEEVACEFSNGLSFDINGDAFPVWGPTFWTSDSEFTTILLDVNGTWKQIDGKF